MERNLEASSQPTGCDGAAIDRLWLPEHGGPSVPALVVAQGRVCARPLPSPTTEPEASCDQPLWKTACTWPGRTQLKDAVKIDRSQCGGPKIHYNSNRTINKAPKLNKSHTIMD